MAKAVKKVKKKVRGKYDEKLAVNGSFIDILKAAGKDANVKSPNKSS